MAEGGVTEFANLDAAGAAIDAILNQKETPATAPVPEPKETPQAAAPQAPVETPPETPVVEAETPVADAPTAPEVDAKAAKAAVESQELSNRMQEATRKSQEADAARSQFVNALNTLVPQLESAIKGEFADIKTFADLQNIANTDPARYNRFVIANAQLQQAQNAQAQAHRVGQEAAQQQHRQWQEGQQQILGQLIPDLGNPDKGPTLARKLNDYALKAGYSPQQLSMASANDFAMLNKSMQYDNLQEAKAVAMKKAANAPPVQTPGVKTSSNKQDQNQSDYERLQRTGRVDDAAAVFRNILG